ncbi:hypothetical protein K2Z83_19980 [Oscillochloris sp. ZM17-4]|uniref:hypothetical protein n=1 Tax=Oscillochloris sp. ZM17-4 TaxID=2866714 RepID=UPI001C72DD2E|nr:hypothetical protein [Oscillochloris sp. ZM17-4]MBX0329949.1 hypothetical protein [Oscillochloris sp. ZM17-4]
MITYARPRLLTADDRRYRAYVDGFKLQRKNNKAIRPPRQRDLFGGEAEAALRAWLEPQVELDDRRIIEYEERRNRQAFVKYREVDALAVDARAIWAFEFKASRSASSLRRAVAQLQETRQILRLLRHTVRVTILLVDTGIPASAAEVDALMASDRPPPRRPELLAEVLAALPALRLVDSLAAEGDGETIDVLRFSVEDIIAMAGAESLHLDWATDDEEPEEEPGPRPAASLYASSSDEQPAGDDDDDDSPLAAALRRAGLE